MKLLSEEEYHKIPRISAGNWSPFALAVKELQVGQILFISKDEWWQKTPPSKMLTRYRKMLGTDYTFETASDGSGWVIKRIK